MCSSLSSFSFIQSINDYSLFVWSKGDTFVILLVYVDNIILTSNCICEINCVKDFLKSQVLIKDFGELKYFLGIEVMSVNGGICLNQEKSSYSKAL